MGTTHLVRVLASRPRFPGNACRSSLGSRVQVPHGTLVDLKIFCCLRHRKRLSLLHSPPVAERTFVFSHRRRR